MARTNNLSNFLTDVAGAIKQKKGDDTNILASEFDTEILALPSQGTYQNKQVNITTNGNYDIIPDEGYDAMEKVRINVTAGENLDTELNAQDERIAELEAALENKTAGKAKPNVFVQETEPSTKKGIWIESADYEIEHTIADEDIFESESWNTTKMSSIKSIPYRFYQGSAVAINTDIYLFGSKYSTTASNHQIAYKYDTLTDTYTRLTDIPYEFYQGSAVAVGTDIYLLGNGIRNYKYDVLTDTYTQVRNIPYSFIEGLATAVGTNIYLFGSSNSSYGQYAYKYDTVTNSYTKLTNVPTRCYMTSAVAIGTDIYLFCCYNGSLYKYDTTSDTYVKLANLPYNTAYSSAVAVNNIYLFGGESGKQYAYKYDTVTNTYTKLSDIPYAFYKGSAILIEDRAEVYLLGGSDNPTKVQIMEFNSADYENNSFVISQGVAKYSTEILANDNNIKFWFNNAWVYTTEDGLVKGLPTYYGDGTQWIKFKN